MNIKLSFFLKNSLPHIHSVLSLLSESNKDFFVFHKGSQTHSYFSVGGLLRMPLCFFPPLAQHCTLSSCTENMLITLFAFFNL